MERNIEGLKKRLYSLTGHIDAALEYADFQEYGDLSGIEYDPRDPEQRLLVSEYQRILELLGEAQGRLEYLQRPTGGLLPLHKNERGRYETTEREYTSGGGIEYLQDVEIYSDGEPETVKEWRRSRVEHDGKDYYIVGERQTPLDGLIVRERER